MLCKLLYLGPFLFNIFVVVNGSPFRHFFSPKRIMRGMLREEDDYDDYDEFPYLRPMRSPYHHQIQPVYYYVPQFSQMGQYMPQQPPGYSYWQQQQPYMRMPGQQFYPNPPPKEVEHRMYSTRVIDECPPFSQAIPQQPGYYYQQQHPPSHPPLHQIPPINLYLSGEARQQPISGGSYSINLPPLSSSATYQSPSYQPVSGGHLTKEERERQFRHKGNQALRFMEEMFDEMGKTTTPADSEEYLKKREELLRQFKTMFDEFNNQYVKALEA